jgi:hypothetical protein
VTAAAASRVTVAAIFGETVALVRRGGARVAIAFIAVTAVAVLADAYAPATELNVIVGGVNFGMLYWLTGASLDGLGRLRRGRRVGAAFVLCIATGLGILLGFAFLIVPGVILFVRWSISLPWLFAEDGAIGDAVAGSWEATRGSFWPILLTFVSLWVPIVAGAAIAVVVQPQWLGGLPGFILSDSLISASQIAQWHAAVAIYILLRPGNELAELFG